MTHARTLPSQAPHLMRGRERGAEPPARAARGPAFAGLLAGKRRLGLQTWGARRPNHPGPRHGAKKKAAGCEARGEGQYREETPDRAGAASRNAATPRT